MSKHRVLLCLGSNLQQAKHINAAQRMLSDVFDNVRYTRSLWTDPIGISPDRYLNCLATLQTELSYQAVNALLKSMEQQLGRTIEDKAKHIAKIDIDILQYDDTPYHLQDRERNYVKLLLEESNAL